MTRPDPYAPKRGGNPADSIIDQNVRRLPIHSRPLPQFLRRDPPPLGSDLPPPAMFDPAPTVEVEPAVWPQQPDPRLAEYIDEGSPVDAAPQPPHPKPHPPVEPTDKQYVALNIDRLRHLDLKALVAEMFGETIPTSPAEIADKMATWAAANNPRAAA